MAYRYVFLVGVSILFTIGVLIYFSHRIFGTSSEYLPNTDWNQVGTLVYNNPGMKQGVWFLIYEQPGHPALSQELEFDPASACAIDAPAAPCNPATMKPGVRVRVEGTIVGNAVLVQTIQLPEEYSIPVQPSATSTPTKQSTSTPPQKNATTSQAIPPTSTQSTGTSTSATTTSPSPSIPVKLYYYNPKLDTASSGIQCSKAGLTAVSRTLQPTNTPLQDTIKLLLLGNLTESEKAQGLTPEFPLPDVTLLSASNDNGTLTLTFHDPKNKTSGGSCRSSIMWAEIEATAKQFPGVQAVRYAPESLFQP